MNILAGVHKVYSSKSVGVFTDAGGQRHTCLQQSVTAPYVLHNNVLLQSWMTFTEPDSHSELRLSPAINICCHIVHSQYSGLLNII